MLEVKVIPQSGKSQLVVDKSGVLKCYVKSAPEKGKANQELIEIVSKVIGILKRDIEVVSGLTSRKKLLKIKTEQTYENIINLMGSGFQKKIF